LRGRINTSSRDVLMTIAAKAGLSVEISDEADHLNGGKHHFTYGNL
jgi:hypothetical protein